MKEYTASKSLPLGRSVWAITFRHPLRRDHRGKFGLKVRRSLGTTQEIEADRLVQQMNMLLADSNLHSTIKRSEAERRFESVIVSAFYDPLENATGDPSAIRDAKLPLPKSGIPKVLLAGVTGSGKTSLLRQLIGSDPKDDRFPSTSTSRTTTCNIEIIVEPSDIRYGAVVTFISQWEATAKIAECVSSACLEALHGSADDKVSGRLLHHPDQIFRLNYILGSHSTPQNISDSEWGYEGESASGVTKDDSGELSVTTEEKTVMQGVVARFVTRVRSLAVNVRARTEQDLGTDFDQLSSADKDTAEEYFIAELEDLAAFDDLVADILDEIVTRFEHLPSGNRSYKSGGWPESWTFECLAADRDDFIRRVRWFTSNYAPAFGKLVTPLVEGIRVRGPFRPHFTTESVRLVLFDGQGFGHTPESNASVSTQVTKRYAEADAIVLVDNAEQPMLPASVSILRSVLSSGYQRKLVIGFTHADQVSGPNMIDFAAKRAHVVDTLIAALLGLHEALGGALVGTVERDLESRCFMLGWLDKSITAKSKGLAREMERLLVFCQDAILPEVPTRAVPVYDPASLLFAAQSADIQFQELWKARLGFQVLAKVPKNPWQTIKALNRRIALAFDNEEYGDLRPAAELIACLSESIGRFLDKPMAWHGPTDIRQRQAAIDKVRQGVSVALHKFVRDRLLSGPMPEWVNAYALNGKSSTFARAQAIRNIVENAAPIPSEAMSREVAALLAELRALVYGSIRDAGGRLMVDEVSAREPRP